MRVLSIFLTCRPPGTCRDLEIHCESNLVTTIICFGNVETGTPPLRQGFRTAWLTTSQQFLRQKSQIGLFHNIFLRSTFHICQIIARVTG